MAVRTILPPATVEDDATAALQSAAPDLFLTTNEVTELVYLRAAVDYYSAQMDRAAAEIRNLKHDLARAKGENLSALGVTR